MIITNKIIAAIVMRMVVIIMPMKTIIMIGKFENSTNKKVMLCHSSSSS